MNIDTVGQIVDAHPVDCAAAPIVAAGTGLRQGEVFGLRVEDVDFPRRQLHVRRQVRLLGGHPASTRPKGGIERVVPLPDLVAVALAEHLRRTPAVEVERPWRALDGDATTPELVFTSDTGGALNRNEFNRRV